MLENWMVMYTPDEHEAAWGDSPVDLDEERSQAQFDFDKDMEA